MSGKVFGWKTGNYRNCFPFAAVCSWCVHHASQKRVGAIETSGIVQNIWQWLDPKTSCPMETHASQSGKSRHGSKIFWTMPQTVGLNHWRTILLTWSFVADSGFGKRTLDLSKLWKDRGKDVSSVLFSVRGWLRIVGCLPWYLSSLLSLECSARNLWPLKLSRIVMNTLFHTYCLRIWVSSLGKSVLNGS